MIESCSTEETKATHFLTLNFIHCDFTLNISIWQKNNVQNINYNYGIKLDFHPSLMQALNVKEEAIAKV